MHREYIGNLEACVGVYKESIGNISGLRIRGFPKTMTRGTFLEVSMIRIMVFGLTWGLYWGPPIQGNYHLVHDSNCLRGGSCSPTIGRIIANNLQEQFIGRSAAYKEFPGNACSR